MLPWLLKTIRVSTQIVRCDPLNLDSVVIVEYSKAVKQTITIIDKSSYKSILAVLTPERAVRFLIYDSNLTLAFIDVQGMRV